VNLQAHRESFEALDGEWRGLLQKAPTASIFSTPAWLRAWWDTARDQESLALLAMRDGSGLCGIAPMMCVGDHALFLGNSDVCDHHDFLWMPGAEQAVLKAFLGEAVRSSWQSISMEGLVEGSPTLSLLPALAQAQGWSVRQEPDGVSPATALPASWDAYVESLDGRDRHELRRKLRRLTSAGKVTIVDAAKDATLLVDFPKFLDLLRASKEEKAKFLTPQRERFFICLAQAMAQEGCLRLFFLELDGVKVAASFCFDYANTLYLYNSGYDTKYTSLSVGLLLKALLIQKAIEEGKGRYDLLRGSEPYKYSLGAKNVALHKLVLAR